VNVGDKVVIERDEIRSPSKGTWPEFRGRTGTVVEVNEDRKRPHLTEYGVVFGKVRATPTTFGSVSDGQPVWFKAYEMADVAAECRAEGDDHPLEGEGRRGLAARTQEEVA
jgi:hypothetical protein